MNIESRIGVSTIGLTGLSTEEAIDKIAANGFDAIEIWAADFQGVIGYPLRPAVGVWARTCSKSRRKKLQAMLKDFKYVVLHVQLYGTDIAAINPGIRDESRKQYLEALELGIDLGATHVTYHYGSLGDTLGANGPERTKRAFDYHVDMARTILDEAGKNSELKFAYENGYLPQLRTIIDAIDNARFGLLLDVPHATMAMIARGLQNNIIDDLRMFRDKIVEVHAHGLWADVCVTRDHQDLSKNNCVDYRTIMPELKNLGYDGPFLFEVIAPESDDVIERCRLFKTHLIECHNEERAKYSPSFQEQRAGRD